MFFARSPPIDYVVEPAAGTSTDASSGDGDGQMGLAGTGAADARRLVESRDGD